MGEVKRKDIIRDPENWPEIKAKHEKREKELLEKAFEKKGVKTLEALMTVAGNENAAHWSREQGERKTLKDHTVYVESRDPNIVALKQKLNEEITTFAKTRLKPVQSAEKPEGLKGRVTPGASDSSAQDANKNR